MRCVVCDSEGARYRCRYCREPYCSSNCFKCHRDATIIQNSKSESQLPIINKHICKSTPITISQNANESEHSENLNVCRDDMNVWKSNTINNEKVSEPVVSEEQTLFEINKELCLNENGNYLEEQNNEDDDILVLQNWHLSALANNKDICNALKTNELQEMLQTIDKSRSRLDALDAAMCNSREFSNFCDNVLKTIRNAENKYKRSNVFRNQS